MHPLTFAQHVASFVCVYLNRKYLWHMHEDEKRRLWKNYVFSSLKEKIENIFRKPIES